MAHIEFLASELLIHIYDSLDSIQDVLALSETCHRLNDIYRSSQQLRILWRVAERQYGPLADATQLLTHNRSQALHVNRRVNMSMALLRQIVEVGSVAEAWADLYPFKKWKVDYENRRLLIEPERRRVRRAIYRLWLYGQAFHTQDHAPGRYWPENVTARMDFLRQFPTVELADMADVHGVMRDVLACNVCPSNGAVARKVRQRYGEEAGRQLVFNVAFRNFVPAVEDIDIVVDGSDYGFNADRHDLRLPSPPRKDIYHNHLMGQDSHFANCTKSPFKNCHCGNHQSPNYSRFFSLDAGSEGWGDDLSHNWAIADMLKLSPAQILYLKLTKPRKAEILVWLAKSGMGPEWFDNNSDTWFESFVAVLQERNVESFEDVVIEGGVTALRIED